MFSSVERRRTSPLSSAIFRTVRSPMGLPKAVSLFATAGQRRVRARFMHFVALFAYCNIVSVSFTSPL